MSRTFPQALDAERALIGGLIMAPDQIADVLAIVKPTDMYRPDHAAVMLMLAAMARAGEHVDLISVTERAARGGGDEQFGGLAYLIGLVEVTPSTANLGYYAGIVAEKAHARRSIAAVQAAQEALFDEAKPAGEVLADLIGALDTESGAEKRRWTHIAEHIPGVLEDSEKMARGEKPASMGPQIPWRPLRELLETLPRGEIVLVAARPAMGKTAAAMSLAESVAGMGHGVGVVSLEVSTERLARGTLARLARDADGVTVGESSLSASEIERGKITGRQWDRLAEAAQRAGEMPLWINKASDVTADALCADIRHLHRQMTLRGEQLDVVVIDYIGLLRIPESGGKNLAQSIGDASRMLKITADALKITIVALAQLNRKCEERADKRPLLSDLRDSGSLEQDAAVVIFLYREVVYNPEAEPTAAEMIVRKNRYGRIGTAEMVFDGPGMRWMDADQVFYQKHSL